MYERKNLKEILIFLLFTFSITWIIWSLTLTQLTLKISNEILIMFGIFTPSIIGLVMEYKVSGLKGLIKSMKKIVDPRISLRWYLYIFGVMPITMLISYLLLQVTNNSVPKSEFPLAAVPLVFIYILLLMGPLGEEAGWRGFMLRKMLFDYKPFYASVILGFIWSLWHLPLFFLENTIQSQLLENYSFTLAFIGYIFYTLMITIQISILYINTKGNILGVILFHTMANTSLGMLPLILSRTGAITLLVIMMLVTLTLIIYNRRALFKERTNCYE